MNTVNKPWQGRVLEVMYGMGAVILGLGFLVLVLSKLGVYQSKSFDDLPLTSIIPVATMFVFSVFVARGISLRQRWAMGTVIVLNSTGLVIGIMSFPQGIVSTLLFLFLLYAGITCWKHPFYKKS